MPAVTRKFERKGQTTTYLQGWGQRLAGGGSVVMIAFAAVHFLHRVGVDGVANWDIVGWVIGYSR